MTRLTLRHPLHYLPERSCAINRLRQPQPLLNLAYSVGLLLGTLVSCIVPASAAAQDLGSGVESPNPIEATLIETAAPQSEQSLAAAPLAETVVVVQQEDAIEEVQASDAAPDQDYGFSTPNSVEGTLNETAERKREDFLVFSVQAADLAPDNNGTETAPPELDLNTVVLPGESVAQAPDETNDSILKRSQLTGDWGGVRSQLAESGVTFDLYFTQFLQGAAITSGSHAFNYGGRLDALINFDTEKLGLWDGGSFNTHLELRYGNIPQFPSEQGALWPVNIGTGLPLGDSGNLVASSLYLSQQLGDVNLLIGKINVIDLLARDLFFGGWGTQRFMNVSFVAPPSGLLPPTIFGAITNINLDPVTLSFQVFDPNDQTNNYWPNNLFGDGVNFLAGATYATEIANRPTAFNLTGIYSTKTGADLNDLLLPPDVEGGTRQGSYSIAFLFSHLLHQLPDNPREGWGVYLKALIADGNPNIIQGSVITGIGGKGLFANRPQDRFGLGFFYWNFSNDLENALNPVVDFGNEYGLEAYYSYAVTPWFHLTGDVQYIRPANRDFGDALFLGLRASIRF